MRAIAALFTFLLALPAAATQDQWPALFSVHDVADDDQLNIRVRPQINARIIGGFAHDAKDIEVVMTNDRGTWGLVNLADGTGWVSLRYLERQPGQWLGALPQPTYCSGTEPFWSFSYDTEGQTRFAAPDRDPQMGKIAAHHPADNRRDRHALIITQDDDQDEDDAAAYALLRLDQCSDGMSDRHYGISLDLLLNEGAQTRLLSGCCRLSQPGD